MADTDNDAASSNPETAPSSTLLPEDLAKRWLAEVSLAEKGDDKFRKRGERITRRYRDEQSESNPNRVGAKFNLFWSNIQTLAPATYSRRPKVEVTRRFRDEDPVARLAGMILERGLQYEIDCKDDFHETMKAVVLDRLLPGRGVAWVRYEPAFKEETAEVPDDTTPGAVKQETVEVLSDERTPVDYVYWGDFLVSPARTWADARWIGRRLMFGKEALSARFAESIKKLGGDISEVPIDYDPAKADLSQDKERATAGEPELASLKRAVVYELWDKEGKQLIWVAKGCQYPLDVVSDVLEIEDFWPIPKPLFATQTNDKIEPVADYVIYQEQLRELDSITQRISTLVEALRLIGVYDASQASLQTLLASGLDNRMVPVNSWAAFAEKGGLKGSMDFLPLEMVVKVLTGLYDARERVKQTIFEITGMSDIVRGQTVASETLGAQEIKAKFANLRLSSRQQQVAEFVTGVLKIKAHIMCQQYSDETLIRISSARQLPEAQPLPAPPQQPGPDGQPLPPQPPQPNQEFEQRLQAALQLLRDERTRNYRIEVQSSSLVELDEVDERQRRNDFMSSVSNFMLAMKNAMAVAPEMGVVSLEMLKFVVRGFSVGRSLESAIEDATEAMRQRLANPAPPPPDPTVLLKKEIEGIKQAAETERELIKAETATDVAELKAAVELVTQQMAEQAAAVAAIQQGLDAQSTPGAPAPQGGM
jgi:hypothetical protein